MSPLRPQAAAKSDCQSTLSVHTDKAPRRGSPTMARSAMQRKTSGAALCLSVFYAQEPPFEALGIGNPDRWPARAIARAGTAFPPRSWRALPNMAGPNMAGSGVRRSFRHESATGSGDKQSLFRHDSQETGHGCLSATRGAGHSIGAAWAAARSPAPASSTGRPAQRFAVLIALHCAAT